MLTGDCNVCINNKLPSYSATCVECGLSRKNYKPITNYDRLHAMSMENMAEFIAGNRTDCYRCAAKDLCEDGMCKNAWLRWLQSMAEEGEE